MIKEFFIKQAVKYGAKDLPKNQQDMLKVAVDKDPALFAKISKEVEALKKKGKPEEYASFDVMKKYQKELQALFHK